MQTVNRMFSEVPTVINMVLAILVGAVSIQLFMAPFDIAPAGVTGISVILNELLGTPVGIVILILNIPILLIGYRYLNGMRMIVITVIAVVGYSLAIDLITPLLPTEGLSDNELLNAMFGGITGGISTAFILRAGGTYGGTSTIAVIIQRKTGTPLSTTYLYTDLAIIGIAGLVFGWESALYATVALFISGVATDYVLEGPSIIRVVFIITDKPREVSDVILSDLQRGVTGLPAKGMWTESERTLLYVTISRAEVNALRDMVADVDDRAFIVIGQGHTAYGAGFKKARHKTKGVTTVPGVPAR
jgi:uncharacterized membrane-anchored protein YitT (DUF2179 family)